MALQSISPNSIYQLNRKGNQITLRIPLRPWMPNDLNIVNELMKDDLDKRIIIHPADLRDMYTWNVSTTGNCHLRNSQGEEIYGDFWIIKTTLVQQGTITLSGDKHIAFIIKSPTLEQELLLSGKIFMT